MGTKEDIQRKGTEWDCFRICMEIAANSKNVWAAMIAQNCAIAIAHYAEKKTNE